MLEDAWLGAALWRVVGGALRLSLFSLNSEWGRLYIDSSERFRGEPTNVIWHNRLKYVHRLTVLHAFHEAQHCRAPVRWSLLKGHCCGTAKQLPQRGPQAPDGRAIGRGQPWPLFVAHTNRSACLHRSPVALYDKARWPRLGIWLPHNLSLREQA